MKPRSAYCGSTNTVTGEPCKNLKDACPHTSHHRSTGEGSAHGARDAASAAAAADALRHSRAALGATMAPPSASSGLASERGAFIAAVRAAANATGLPEPLIIHDYWLVRALYGVRAALPENGEMWIPAQKSRNPDRLVGWWAFGGGTSLTAAWRVGERYSEDIDGSFFADGEISRSGFANVHRRVSNAMCESVEASGHETLGRTVRTTTVDLAGRPKFLKIETALEGPDEGLVAAQEVNSLIAIHAGMSLADEYPEVGGFRIACVRPEWTGINKLDAMHRRAVEGDLEGIADRGRDLYDLWALASSGHADTIREHAPRLWERAAGGMRAPVPRPDGGYGHSPAFDLRTEASGALRKGFADAVNLTVWGDAPAFEDAVDAARSLDS